MNPNILDFIRELKKKLPIWGKAIVILILALVCSVYFFTSCGTTTRVKASTSDGSNLSISIENKSDTDSETNVDPNVPITVERVGSNSYSIIYYK